MKSLFCFLILLSVSVSAAAEAQPAAVVNGITLERWEADRELKTVVSRSSFHRRISEERMVELRQEALEALVLKELKRQWYLAQGYAIDETRVVAAWQQVRDRFSDEDAYKNALKSAGISHEAFLAAFRREVAAEAADEAILNQVTAPKPEDVEAFFESHRKDYMRPESRHLVHVMIHVPPSAPGSQWQETEARLNELRGEVAGGLDLSSRSADFREAAPPVYQENIGDLGFVHQGVLAPEIDREVFAAGEGEVVGPIRTIFGNHLVQVIAVRDATQLELNELGTAVASRMTRERQTEAARLFDQQIREQAELELSTWVQEH